MHSVASVCQFVYVYARDKQGLVYKIFACSSACVRSTLCSSRSCLYCTMTLSPLLFFLPLNSIIHVQYLVPVQFESQMAIHQTRSTELKPCDNLGLFTDTNLSFTIVCVIQLRLCKNVNLSSRRPFFETMGPPQGINLIWMLVKLIGAAIL